MKPILAPVALLLALIAGNALTATSALAAPTYQDPPFFADAVKKGDLPAVSDRLPADPMIAAFEWPDQTPGQYGGDLATLMSNVKDIKYLIIYGYAELVTYDSHYNLVPNVLKSFEVEGQKVFTFHLRKGMKWSNGNPFTSEDFRFYWEDVATNKDLNPLGPPVEFLVDGELPKVEVVDKTTIRYSWSKPNPGFLPALALEPNFFIYQPSKFLKKYHAKYADKDALDALVKDAGARSWAQLFNRKANQYRNDSPSLPTLEPWVLKTKPPADRFIFERNPYYFRVDPQGHQLPYIDRVICTIADGKLIPAKTGAGESMLQGLKLRFADYTFLKEAEKTGKFRVLLWKTGNGSSFALYPNLTATDPAWRQLLRDVRFRRALSLAINRDEINQAIFGGLARESANTVLSESALYKKEFQNAYAQFDIDAANKLLDEIGLTKRDGGNFRLLPDGRPLAITVETASQVPEEADILELIRDSWGQIGVKLYTKPFEQESFRGRIFNGDTLISAWSGLDNGLPTAESSPVDLAPANQYAGLQWSKWGQYFESHGRAGEAPDMPEAKELLALLDQWSTAMDNAARTEIWQKMLGIYTDQVFTIGTVNAAPQPVVASTRLHNLPKEAIWSFSPGEFFGVYRPDIFWLDPAP
ncbi:MAG TPA: ABC transporter substrate-binding protein [Dongiaceae bacterium]|nr:ABC transporter substrate-binding protein [Dongiaceae bacterium]